MASRTPSSLRFGTFEFDPTSGDLRKHGLNVRLTPQARELMCIFAEAPNAIHSRKEIQGRLWPDNTFVDFVHGVNKVVHMLREALGDSARNPRFIETVAGSGYRFMFDSSGQPSARSTVRSKGSIERIAVLPLQTDAEAEMESMGRIITWLLTTNLAAVPNLRVIADSMVKSEKLGEMNPQQAGAYLDVEAILVGELIRQHEHLALRIEMIDTADGTLVGGALVEHSWQPGANCEKEIAAEACRQVCHILSSLPQPESATQQAILPGPMESTA